MKKLEWHNPANATPPEGYRLLIANEVGEVRIKGALVFTIFKKWVVAAKYPNNLGRTYAVPQDTPLPEGYAVIDGELWQMHGWRIVEQEEAPETKPMTATDIMEQRYPKDHAADRAWAVTQQMSQQLEDFRTVLAENQRLRNELADARATLNSIRSLLP